MFFSKGTNKLSTLILFALAGFVMMTGYIFITALSGAVIRDYTPEEKAGKLQGVRMIFSLLYPCWISLRVKTAI